MLFGSCFSISNANNFDKNREQSDTISFAFDCGKWTPPSSDTLLIIIPMMREMDSREWYIEYGNWCQQKGKIYFEGRLWNYSVDAAGTVILYNDGDTESRFFGCYTNDCWKYFPEEASVGRDSLGRAVYDE